MGGRPPTSRIGTDPVRLPPAVLLLLAWLVGAVPAGAAGEHVPGRPSLRLVWCDIEQRTPFPFEEMTAEVERILGGADVEVTWRIADSHNRYDDTEIPVILLDRGRARGAASRHVMGSTHRDPAHRAAWVYSSTVLWALGLANTPLLTREQQRDLARGLGRVVAHEIVHAIAPDLPHTRTGLMQPAMNRTDLLKPGLSLDKTHRRVFVARVTALSPDPGDRSAAFLAPERGRGESGLVRGAALSR